MGDDAYTFTFSARQSDYQEYLPPIEKMINSFKFVNIPVEVTQVKEEPKTEQAEITTGSNKTTPSSIEAYTSLQIGQNQTSNVGGGLSLPYELPPATSIQTENDTDQLGQAASIETVGWHTYQDSQYGFKIQYPQEWRIDEDYSTTLIKPLVALIPGNESSNILDRTEVTVRTKPIEDTRTLDPETLQVKEIPYSLEGHANSYIMSFSGNLKILKNEAITLNGEPAWSLQFILNSYGSQLSYGSVIYMIKDKELFEIDFTTPPFRFLRRDQ